MRKRWSGRAAASNMMNFELLLLLITHHSLNITTDRLLGLPYAVRRMPYAEWL
jgi:hypothetical protein